MRRFAGIMLVLYLLTGCSSKNNALDQAATIRKNILDANQCSFDVTITAFYDEYIHTFEVICVADHSGTLQFTVISPESISGITGTISNDGAALTYDNTILAFPMLADGRVSPISGTWLFLNTLRSGYLTGCGENEAGLNLSIDDTFEDNPLHLEIQTDQQHVPIAAEIYYQQKRVLLLEIRNFTLQ